MHVIFDYKAKFVSNLLLIVLEVVAGILLICLPAKDIINFFLGTIGVILIVCNIIPCFQYFALMNSDKKYTVDFVSSIISVALGVLLLVLPGVVLSVILACWFIIMPIVRIIIHPNHNEQFKKELPLLIIGLILTVFSFSFLSSVIIKVIGGLVILSAVFHLIYAIRIYSFAKQNLNQSTVDENVINAEFKDL